MFRPRVEELRLDWPLERPPLQLPRLWAWAFEAHTTSVPAARKAVTARNDPFDM
jgi:hypothetical protein